MVCDTPALLRAPSRCFNVNHHNLEMLDTIPYAAVATAAEYLEMAVIWSHGTECR